MRRTPEPVLRYLIDNKAILENELSTETIERIYSDGPRGIRELTQIRNIVSKAKKTTTETVAKGDK